MMCKELDRRFSTHFRNGMVFFPRPTTHTEPTSDSAESEHPERLVMTSAPASKDAKEEEKVRRTESRTFYSKPFISEHQACLKEGAPSDSLAMPSHVTQRTQGLSFQGHTAHPCPALVASTGVWVLITSVVHFLRPHGTTAPPRLSGWDFQ